MDRDEENHLQLPGNISHREGREVLRFLVVYVFREHCSFRLTGHVAMVRFKFQLTGMMKKTNVTSNNGK